MVGYLIQQNAESSTLLRRAHAAIKFPIKVQLCRTFIPLLRDTCPEPSLPCKDEGDIRKSFLGNFFGI